MYRKSLTAKMKERKRLRSLAGVEARRRKRMELGATLQDVGGFATDGILGAHVVRILSYGEGGRHYAITVDGKHRFARTERGIIRCIARMVCAKIKADARG